MPNFISEGGIFHAVKETVGLVYKGKKRIARKDLPKGVTIPEEEEFLEPGADFIYNGPDRASLSVIHSENNGGVLGQSFKNDPEFIQSVRNRGFNTVEDYLKSIGYNEEEERKKFESKVSRVKAHEVEKRVKEIEVLAGGKDYADGGNDIIGGFGEEKLRKPAGK